MARPAKIWQILTAVLTILAAIALIAQAVGIYRAGVSPENLSGDGVYIQPVYSREIVSRRLAQIAPLLTAWAIAVIAGLFLPRSKDEGAPEKFSQKNPPKPGRALRIAIAAAAVVLVALGVLNGGMRDVLIKAVNICTECIGLG